MGNKHTNYDLAQMQSLPLEAKIKMTTRRIEEWVEHFGEDGVYISFSGGKDSAVLLDIARKIYPDLKAMFVDVPTQYPELKEFVQTFDNVDIIKPKISFAQVCEKYGFPLISKEVSESVYGARKYLTSILSENPHLTDRQTDRQHPYKYYYEKVTGTGKYSKFSDSPSNAEIIEKKHFEAIRGGTDTNINTKYRTCLEQLDNVATQKMSRGGYDRKYLRIRGIGEFTRREDAKETGWKQSEISNNVGNVRQRQQNKGEHP